VANEKVTRRLAAIFAADMVGFSRLMEADEEGTIARQKALRNELIDPKIAEHGGRIVKTTGDGMLVEFASVVDAVRCAVEVQQAMAHREADEPDDRRICYRIGINLGDIVIEDDDVFGDGVNVAARLEALANPGDVLISGSAFDQLKKKLEYGYRFQGERKVKNIADPVRAYTVLPDAEAGTVAGHRHWASKNWVRLAGVSTAVLLLIVVGLAWWQPWELSTKPQRQALSIVVLPFNNVGGDRSQDYIADAITNQLTIHLARIPGTLVIARNTAFAYKGKSVDVRQIGKDLRVRFVLEGSIQAAASRIRVNARLINSRTGAHLWAETFDKKRTDQLQLQDEIVKRISRALHIELSAVEAARLDQPDTKNVNAEALATKCESMLIATSPSAKRMYETGYSLCEQAIRLDPINGRALSILAIKHGVTVTIGGSKDRQKDIQLAQEYASRALAANPRLYLAHVARSYAFSVLGKHQEAIAAGQRANDLNPSFLGSYLIMLASGLYIGQPEKTVEWAGTAIRISPRDPLLYGYYNLLGRAHYMLGQRDQAIQWLRKSVAANPSFPNSQAYLAAMLGATGRSKEARKVLNTYLSLKRTRARTIAQWNKVLRTKNPKYLASFKQLTEGLRKAGMPEN